MTIEQPHVIQVAIARPLSGYFDYECATLPPRGARLLVPFGRSTVLGVCAGAGERREGMALKAVEKVLDAEPVIGAEVWALVEFAARYYQHPVGEVVAAALPVALRKGAANVRELPLAYALTETGAARLAGRLGEKQRLALQWLADHGETDATRLQAECGVSPAWLKALADKGWLSARAAWQAPVYPALAAPQATAAQQAALEVLNGVEKGTVLLEGVTGSGKTEVYIRHIERLVAGGGQVLVLVPEIGLVQMMLARLGGRLPVPVVAHHSGMTDAQRLASWQAVRAGEAKVLVGTRSAVFAEFADLRGIIIDEEHDLAYKQQDGLRYHARDLAAVRAHRRGIPLLLGSATPSLETLHLLHTGRARHVRLTGRVEERPMPEVVIEDVQQAQSVGFMSVNLLRAVRRALKDGEQVLFFLNRRGYAPLLSCEQCGWTAECEACDAKMTAHTATRNLRCHHCGRQAALPARCPDCGHGLQMIGLGTQRLEQAVRQQFPQARVLRIDSDAYSTAKQFQEAVAQVAAGEVDILLGTQWLSKGHHFPRLNLVAVMDADQALYSTDFRSEERLAQMLVQVAGRAGRETPGQVWVQTRQAQHPVFRVLQEGYAGTAMRLYRERERMQLPPFAAQVLLQARHRDEARALQTLQLAREGAQGDGIGADWLWLGPAPALLARKDREFRAHLLVQAPSRGILQAALPALNGWLQAQAKETGAQAGMDVDPLWLE
ncbi:MAG: primosomal protein N' [Cardiobacteriaceae bacterium]|nr:primosomal protein N' [Cardiobacteriaceae bacterium]